MKKKIKKVKKIKRKDLKKIKGGVRDTTGTPKPLPQGVLTSQI